MDKKKLFGTIFFVLLIIFYIIWGENLSLSLFSVIAIILGFLGLFVVPTQNLGKLWWKILFRKYLFLLFIIFGVADLPISSDLKLTVIFFILALGMLVSSRRGLLEM
jgi:hypothetical protein